jgi:hypothetical protein
MTAPASATLHAIGLVGVRHQRRAERWRAATWQDWISANFSGYLWPPYADYHAEFWEWAWSIEAGQPARPFVAIWPRGFAKSTSTEVACALMAGEQKRTYGLYICATQDRADDHVANVAGLLESSAFSRHYPKASQRKLGKFGNSKGWRRNRLRTASGFTLDAIGLDTAARGAKVDEDRPDFLIFDDIDGVLDAPGTVEKKITTITQSLLPSRAAHAAVLVAQNLIHEDGVVGRLADGRADFLADRIVSGPHAAIANLAIEQRDGKAVIVGGDSTWPAMSILDLQRELNEIGLTAFMREKQHDVGNVEGSIFEHVAYRHCERRDVPDLEVIVVWVDPAVTDTDQSDAHGIQADGRATSGDIYRLYSWEARTSPQDAIERAILKAVELGAITVGVETDQGGDTWQSVYNEAWERLKSTGQLPAGTVKPRFKQAKAGAGHGPKAYRASQMLAAYERGEIIHVIGTHDLLERGLRRYLIRKPYDLVDAAYWSWRDLARRGGSGAAAPAAMPQASKWRGR